MTRTNMKRLGYQAIVVVLLTLVILAGTVTPVYALPGDLVEFGDDDFQHQVLLAYQQIDSSATVADLTEANVAKITLLSVNGENITSLAGIEHLLGVETLFLYDLAVAGSLVIGDLPNLREILFQNYSEFVSEITDIKFENLPLVNEITMLSLTNLENITFTNAAPSIMDISYCEKLKPIDFSGNGSQMIEFSVFGCPTLAATQSFLDLPDLSTLYFVENDLTKLDLSGLSNLESLFLGYNYLTSDPDSLDLTQTPNLLHLCVSDNKLTKFDTSAVKDLEYLCLSNEVFPSDNYDTYEGSMEDFWMCNEYTNNRIKSIDVSGMENLCFLNLTGNMVLEEVIVKNNPNLVTLMLSGNNLSELVIGENVDFLMELDIEYNRISKLDLSAVDLDKRCEAEFYECMCIYASFNALTFDGITPPKKPVLEEIGCIMCIGGLEANQFGYELTEQERAEFDFDCWMTSIYQITDYKNYATYYHELTEEELEQMDPEAIEDYYKELERQKEMHVSEGYIYQFDVGSNQQVDNYTYTIKKGETLDLLLSGGKYHNNITGFPSAVFDVADTSVVGAGLTQGEHGLLNNLSLTGLQAGTSEIVVKISKSANGSLATKTITVHVIDDEIPPTGDTNTLPILIALLVALMGMGLVIFIKKKKVTNI